MPTKIKNQPTSEEIMTALAATGEPVVLQFSCGKDSVAAWLAMREHGIEPIPVYLWLVPELEFVEDDLAYFEEVFKTKIYRYPHPSFYRFLRNGVFQPPERIRVLEAANIPNITYDIEWPIIFEDLGIKGRPWLADGVRAADSLVRRASFVRNGVMKSASHKVSPVADWLKGEVMGAIDAAGIQLPIDYELFGRSFDGIDYRFTKPLRDHLPEDYAVLCDWFPLIPADIARREAYDGL